MKKILASILALAFCATGFAQLDRSVRPEPAAAEPLNFGEYELFTLDNGLNIIVVENDKLPRVAFSLIVDRMPIKEGDKAGYVSMAGELLRQGTTNRNKSQLDEEIDFIGANLFTGSSNVYVSGLSKYTETLVELMADVALNPAFPQEEFDKLKKQNLSGIESAKENPDQLSARLFNRTVYGESHPYGELETEATINNITVEDCKNYYNNYWAPNKTYIAVVGDIKARKAKKLIEEYFGDWARKETPSNEYEAPATPTGKVVNMINRSNASQTVLRMGNTIDLKPGAADVVKLRLTNQVLGGGSLGRLFKNIREDKGYTYGAYSGYDEDRLIGEFSANASVRNEVTDSAVTEFLKEFKRLHNEPVPAEELQAAKNYISGSFGRSLESPQTIASFALNIQRYGLPEDYYENYLQRLDKLTATDVQNAAKKYIKLESMTITAVGKASEVAEKLEKFGPVTYYNFQGEKTAPPSMPVPEGVTAESVLQDYVKALGGEENLKKVKDITMQMDASIAGAPPSMQISAVRKRMRPHYFFEEVSMTGRGVMSKQVFNGEKAISNSMMGGTQEFTEGEEFEAMKDEAIFFPETQYGAMNYKMELVGMEMVDGKKAYAMEVTTPEDETYTEYYDANTGLKIREVTTQETPQGEMTVTVSYSDYREVNGVMFPYEISQAQGPQKFTMTVTDLKLNSGLKKSEFK